MTGPEDTDEELVRRWVAGDGAAFADLVRRHERRTYNLALRIVGREEDARDATQEAFLSALRKLPSFRGDSAFSTWLHRVTVNACYDLLRRRARAPLRGGEEREEPAPGRPPLPDHADAVATAVDVRAALLRVPEEFRAVLVLHDVQDLPYEEIAEILGLPVGTVKSRLHRARVALGRALGSTGERAAAPRSSDGER
ncbi:MAG TPA: sigma-70 family RNA polymerase sigma factor [Actinomycetota bacterium]|nr:sigma-70 family RNA polymerase sigma factor [Actinomycetota bacterium]